LLRGIHDRAHADGGGVPAGRTERAEMGFLRRFLVHVKRLRVVAAREAFDFLGCERVLAKLARPADFDVVEEAHQDFRFPNIAVKRISSTFSPRWFRTSHCWRTSPTAGRLLESRVSRTVCRTESASPGRTGFFHFTSSMPGDPCELESSNSPSHRSRIITTQVCQPEAPNPPRMVFFAALSSRCIGCGSNSDAKPTISSRVTVRGPNSRVCPTVKSS